MMASRVAFFASLCVLAFVSNVQSQYDEYAADDYGYGEEYGDEADEKDVVVVTSSNFEEIILNAEYALVEFYAPWCGHCKSLAPEYAMAATELKEIAPQVIVAKVDATVEEDLGQMFNIEGFPTLKWFVNGEASDYDGDRDGDGIISWVKKRTGPPATTVETVEEAEKMFEKKNGIFALFDAFEGPRYEAFQEVAKAEGKVDFVQTLSKDVASALGVESLTFIRNFDDGNMHYDGDWSVESLTGFVKRFKIPRVIPLGKDMDSLIFESGIDLQVIIFAGGEQMEEATRVAAEVSEKHAGEVIFVSVDTDVEDSKQVLEFFSLETSDTIAQAMGFRSDSGTKFKFIEEYTVQNLKSFTEKLIADELEPFLKSEEPPEENDGPVTIVVGTTFEAIAKDPTKDVLLEVYAPWCGHCKKLIPTYNKLGKRFQKIDSVVIAKMDGTENEHPELRIEGFPTFFFFPATAESEMIPMGEEVERTLPGLTKFVKENAEIPYELPKKKPASEPATGETHEEL